MNTGNMAESFGTTSQTFADVRLAHPSRFGDRLFKWLAMGMGLSVGVLIVLVGVTLWHGAAPDRPQRRIT